MSQTRPKNRKQVIETIKFTLENIKNKIEPDFKNYEIAEKNYTSLLAYLNANKNTLALTKPDEKTLIDLISVIKNTDLETVSLDFSAEEDSFATEETLKSFFNKFPQFASYGLKNLCLINAALPLHNILVNKPHFYNKTNSKVNLFLSGELEGFEQVFPQLIAKYDLSLTIGLPPKERKPSLLKSNSIFTFIQPSTAAHSLQTQSVLDNLNELNNSLTTPLDAKTEVELKDHSNEIPNLQMALANKPSRI